MDLRVLRLDASNVRLTRPIFRPIYVHHYIMRPTRRTHDIKFQRDFWPRRKLFVSRGRIWHSQHWDPRMA